MKKKKCMTIITLIMLLSMILFGCNPDTPSTPDENQQGGGTETPVDPDNPEVKPEGDASAEENGILLAALNNLGKKTPTQSTTTYSRMDISLNESNALENDLDPGTTVSGSFLDYRAEGADITETATLKIENSESYDGDYVFTGKNDQNNQTGEDILTKNGSHCSSEVISDFLSNVIYPLKELPENKEVKNAEVSVAYKVLWAYEANETVYIETSSVMKDGKPTKGSVITTAKLVYDKTVIDVKTTSTRVLPSDDPAALNMTTSINYIKFNGKAVEPASINKESIETINALVEFSARDGFPDVPTFPSPQA